MLENAFDEIELLGFPLCSPFDLLEMTVPEKLYAKDLPNFINQNINITAYMITLKRTRTKKGDQMYFGTFIDMEGRFVDTVHFPNIVQKYPIIGRGVYKISGKVVEEFDAIIVEVSHIKHLAMITDPRYSNTPNKIAS